MMFNTASSTQLNAPGMAFQFRPDNGFKRKSSSNIHDEYDSGPSVGMERTDSRDAKRRRIPTGNISCSQYPIDLPFHTNPLVPTLIQHVQQPQEQQIPQQFSQFSNHAPNNILNSQQNQLYTPPLESPGDFQLSCQPIVEDGNFDDMMMDDDCDNTIPATTIDSITTHPDYSRHHSHTAPPSPVTPSLLGVNDYDDNSNPIKWEGTKHKGYPRDAYEDPNANLWTGGRVLRKNMDGQVKGYKMGYMEGCEKCRIRARGHVGHFIMADSI